MSETPDHTPPPASPAAEPQGAPGQPAEHGFFTSIRRTGLARPADRWVGGVSGAIARRLDIDPLVVRALFVASVFFAGVGLVVYGIAWALLPEESDGRIHAQELGRGDADVALLGAAGFVLAGLLSGNRRWTPAGWWSSAGLGWINGVLWLAVVGVVVAIVVSGARMSGPRPTSPVPPPPPAPAYRTATPLNPETPMSTVTPPPPASYTTVPPQPPVPPVPPVPPRPATPPVPGAGARYFAVCAGLTLIAFAGLLLAERAGYFSGPLFLTTLGVTAVVFGTGVVVAGLRGRSSGVLGFFAVMALLLSFPAAAAADADFHPWRDRGRWDGMGSATHTPLTVDEARGGFAVGLGDLVLDLTELEIPAGETVDLTVQAGTGSVELVLPADASARLDLNIGAGEATWDVDGADGNSSGLGVRRTVTNEHYVAGEDPTFDILVNVGLGDIDITQES